MSKKVTRRDFVKKSLTTSTGISIAAVAAGATGAAQGGEKRATGGSVASPESLPRGKIADLEISRLLLGGNLLTHYTHSRDLKYVYSLAKNYNTEEKILETLALAEEHGVNTLVIHNVRRTMEILVKHRRRGGKMQWITCTRHALAGGNVAEFSRQIEELVDHGADALYISGVEADHLCGFRGAIFGADADTRQAAPRHDLLAQAVTLCRAHGLPVGIGAHRMGVVVDCEKNGMAPDFYVKTLHQHSYPSVSLQHDSRWCSKPEELVKFMQDVKKPWIAYKVMAAGAIPPQSAFRHAFDSGADFVLAGMFDFEVAQDVRIAREALAGCRRTRAWYS